MSADNGHRYGGLPDFILANQMKSAVDNAVYSRASFLQQFFDPRRDIDDECGYPKTPLIRSQDYREMYDRFEVAARVVEVFPSECWRENPEIVEVEDSDTVTEFEEAFDNLGRSLGGPGWYRGDEGNPLWEYLYRADVLSGIGHYGVLLLGLDDNEEFRNPVKGVEEEGSGVRNARYVLNIDRGQARDRKLLYLRSFDESLATITSYETNQASLRYGQPTMYNLSLYDPSVQSQAGVTVAPSLQSMQVHWTRVIHLADNLGSSEILGVPRMRPVFNRLYDLRKLYSGSAEMYWRGAFPGLSLETHPQLGGDVTVKTSTMRDTMENYFNGLQRYLLLMGMSAKTLAPMVVDPTPQIKIQLEAICIKLGIPQRIFMGSERGELASSQDTGSWDDQLRGRRSKYLTPRMIVPFVDRLIMVGVLPEPEEYAVRWPEPEQSPLEKADLALKRIDAMTKYLQGGVESLMVPHDLLTRELDYDDDEAAAILEEAQGAVGERMAGDGSGDSPLLSMVGGITGMTDLFRAAKEGSISPEQLKQSLMLFYKLPEEKADEMIVGMQEQIDEDTARQEEQAKAQAEAMKQAGVNPQQPGRRPPPNQPQPSQPKKPVPPQFQK